jgi:hypothetical protein
LKVFAEGDAAVAVGVDGVPRAVVHQPVLDQSPLGRTARGNPGTYTKAWDRIRARFAAEPAALRAGLSPSHFSFNVAAGRSNAEVARELILSTKTVEWNLSKVYRKLGVRSRSELAARVAEQRTDLRRQVRASVGRHDARLVNHF